MAQEVTAFIVIPPAHLAKARIVDARIIEALLERFPGFGFSLLNTSPCGDQDEFSVIPIMSMVGDQEASMMCEGLDLSAVLCLN